MSSGISYVFPYVDNTDPVWRADHKKYGNGREISRTRSRDEGALKYVFRGLAECMPWLDEVVLLVNYPSQAPDWLQGVRVVTAEEFIPKRYLPVFNSNAVEMFLPNIPNLSEKIIYGNDDYFPCAVSTEGEWFSSEDGAPRIGYLITPQQKSVFDLMLQADWNFVAAREGTSIPSPYFVFPLHGPQPILRSTLEEFDKKYGAQVKQTVTRFRQLDNRTQKVFFDYAIATHQAVWCSRGDGYCEPKRDYLDKLVKMLWDGKQPSVCINNTENDEEAVVKSIPTILEKRWPKKCKYEVGFEEEKKNEDQDSVNQTAPGEGSQG